ncbi:hypothetical protein C8J57DRAFT_1709563, partial [Mycena rebaudengoi]
MSPLPLPLAALEELAGVLQNVTASSSLGNISSFGCCSCISSSPELSPHRSVHTRSQHRPTWDQRSRQMTTSPLFTSSKSCRISNGLLSTGSVAGETCPAHSRLPYPTSCPSPSSTASIPAAVLVCVLFSVRVLSICSIELVKGGVDVPSNVPPVAHLILIAPHSTPPRGF